MKYAIHTLDGKTWFCQEIVPASHFIELIPDALYTSVKFAMTGARLHGEPVAEVVFLTSVPVSIEVLRDVSVTVKSRLVEELS